MVNEMIVRAAVSRQTQNPKLAAARDESTGASDGAWVVIDSPPDVTRGGVGSPRFYSHAGNRRSDKGDSPPDPV